MLLTDILTGSAQRFAHYPALTMRIGFRTISFTYAQVEEQAKKVAQFLADQGIKPGDCVLLCGPNSPYWIIVWWGALMRGCVVVPLAPQNTQEMMQKIAQQTEAKLFFKSLSVRQTVSSIPTFMLEYLPDLIESYKAPIYALPDQTDHDLAEIMYTSGTTGDPKGVMLSHNNIASNVAALQNIFHVIGYKERLLSILPLSHMLEQSAGFLLPFSKGAHIIYAHSHGAIKELMQQYHITKMLAVPEFLKLMLRRIEAGFDEKGRKQLFQRMLDVSKTLHVKPLQRLVFFPVLKNFGGKLNTFASGGSALDAELETTWELMGIYVLEGYGLTETSPVITGNTFGAQKIGSVGRPLADIEVRIAQDGEIQVKGPNVFQGYYKNEEKTRESFTSDGWFKTGDMGTFDRDGYLFLRGRKKYMIKGPGAQNIFPEDIETVLNNTAGIKDSCVIGIETQSGAVEIHAVLLLSSSDIDPEAIVHAANAQLAEYQHITGWTVWPEQDFPRSLTRKVKKEEVIKFVKSKQQGAPTHAGQAVSPLMNILAQISGVDIKTIQPTTKLLHDLKFDSLMRIELVARVEELRGITIDERLITATTTVADLEQIIATAKPITKVPRVNSWPRTWWARIIRRSGGFIPKLLGLLFFKFKVKGLENLEGINQPVLFMPNHITLLDGLTMILALPPRFRHRISFAAAVDVLYEEYGSVAWLVELFFNSFPFPRKEHEHVATGLLNMGTMLDDGYSVVMFPEGKMSESGKLLPLKRGAGLVAVEMNTLIVPVKIEGVEKLMPFDNLVPRKRGPVTVTFGKPIRFARSTQYDQATETIYRALKEM